MAITEKIDRRMAKESLKEALYFTHIRIPSRLNREIHPYEALKKITTVPEDLEK